MNSLFDSDPLVPSIEPLEEGAVLLRGFVHAEVPRLLEQVTHVAQVAPFRHLVTPGGYTMSVAMTNCGRVGWVSDRKGYWDVERARIGTTRDVPVEAVPDRLGRLCRSFSWISR